MAGGARVVPVDYRLDEKELVNLLEQINGLYIPGDTKQTYLDPEVQIQVAKILRWAQEHNSDHAQHFPVVTMGYGMPTMLQSQF